MKLRWLTVAFIICLAMAGLNVTAAHEGGPHVRVAHLAPAAGAVDVYINEMVIPAVKFPAVTDYMALEGHEFKVMLVPAGKAMSDALTKEPVMLTFAEGDTGFYTVAAVGSPADGTFAAILLPPDGESKAAAMSMGESGKAEAGNIEISGAFVRPTAMSAGHDSGGGHGGMDMGKVSAAYMMIMNKGNTPDRLVKVEADFAGKIETHETMIENEVAKMVPIAEGFEIPAGGMVELKPGGKHIMLMELKRDLVPGEVVTLVLSFESGTVVTLPAPVRMP